MSHPLNCLSPDRQFCSTALLEIPRSISPGNERSITGLQQYLLVHYPGTISLLSVNLTFFFKNTYFILNYKTLKNQNVQQRHRTGIQKRRNSLVVINIVILIFSFKQSIRVFFYLQWGFFLQLNGVTKNCKRCSFREL